MSVKLQRELVEKHFGHSGDRYDVIVAGGGPAGIGAALGAAINGAKTLLLEEKPFMGGVGAVSGWMPYNRLLRHGKSRHGVHELFVNKILSYGPAASRPGKTSWTDDDGLHIHPDYLRYAILELMEENGVDYRLHSPVTDVIKCGDQLTGVVCDGKLGRSVFYGKTFIDCTGDGDMAFRAGAKAMMGRETDGMFMPITLGFVVANVDEERLFKAIDEMGHAAFTQQIMDAEDEGYSVSMFYSFDKTTVPGVISVNNGGQRNLGVVNALNVTDLNLAERTGLQVAIDFVKICHEKKIAGLEDCYLIRTGQALGVRETRRIEGEYILTMEDSQQDKHFPDVVALRYGTIDPGGLQEVQNFHGTIKDGHQYPYRCMLPKGVEGLLVAGRCASLTHLGLTVCKSQGNMMGIGQAAGVACAIAAKNDQTPREVDVTEVQNRLREMGVELET